MISGEGSIVAKKSKKKKFFRLATQLNKKAMEEGSGKQTEVAELNPFVFSDVQLFFLHVLFDSDRRSQTLQFLFANGDRRS